MFDVHYLEPLNPEPSRIMLSYYFHPTLVEWLKLATYCGMFFLVLNTVKSKKEIDTPLILAALLAIGHAVVHRQRHGVSESFFYHKGEIPLTRFRRFTLFGLVLFVFGFAVYSMGKHFLVESACPTEWNSTMNLTWNPELSDIEKAIALNACNFEYHYKRAGHFMSLNAENKEDRKVFDLEAQKSLEQAVRRNPSNGILCYELGNIYSSGKYDLFDYLNKWLPLADECFDAGIKYAPKDEHILFNVAWYWLWRANILPKRPMAESSMLPVSVFRSDRTDPTNISLSYGTKGTEKAKNQKGEKTRILFRETGIHNFQHYFQRSLALNPVHWKKAAQRIRTYFPDDEIVMGMVPESNEALKSLALKFLAETESSGPAKKGKGIKAIDLCEDRTVF